ncbi:MAG: efflux RND transporter periplasmic adaptor subunit [Salinivirgaceae bacterium]|nr:efflux RND transporter periplasmic adaptor subunit [Salinivirgaceae bacterium]MDD4747848.1 efflux RND transporter periplasmic adaptor subunit [Salinivirgaceae bacterium]MDY0281920.1 efflux RND transporter periplasmic adaptor subunit [Salinivirgaceae bacterium]
MKSISKRVLRSIPIVLIIVNGCSDGNDALSKKSTRLVQKMSVNAVIAKKSNLEQIITLAGNIIAAEEIELKCETQGKLIELNLEEGKIVEKNQLLARVNDSEIRARLDKLEIDLKLAQEELNRKMRLYEIKALSQQEVDIAKNSVDGLKADIQLYKAQLQKTEIRAPFKGRIGLRNVSLGSYITTATVLATLVDDNPAKVEFSLPERYVFGINKGEKVEFSLGHHPKKFEAHIYATESTIDKNTRALKVRALAPNPNGELIPGFFARVFYRNKDNIQSLMIPPHALIPILGGQSIAKYKNGKIDISTIEIGTRTPTSVEVISGVEVGDTIITSGLLQIKDGMAVNVSIDDTW